MRYLCVLPRARVRCGLPALTEAALSHIEAEHVYTAEHHRLSLHQAAAANPRPRRLSPLP